MKNLRNAKITKFPDGSGDFITQVKFHKWGSRPYPLDNGSYIARTVGIVEHMDGTVTMVEPNNIKFDI